MRPRGGAQLCNRRDFCRSVAAVGAVSLLDGCVSRRAESGYDVVVLGDTHYDAESADVYHWHYDEKVGWLNRVQRAEFARNGEMWRDRCPRLLARAGLNVTNRTAFALQVGDLVQGDCGDPLVHCRMLADALDRMKCALGGLPLMTVVGNHDVRGKGAEKAYLDYMPERMTRELGISVAGLDFAFRQGEDVWLSFPFVGPDPSRLDRLLDQTAEARRTFVVCHSPIIPADTKSARWIFLGDADEKTSLARRHLRKRLAERRAIIIGGHTHRLELMDWEGDGGRIVQLLVNSVWNAPELAVPQVLFDRPDQYGLLQKQRIIRDDGKPAPDESAFFDEYRPGLKRYYCAKTAGSCVLHVDEASVTVSYYGGDSSAPVEWKLG